MVGGIGRTLSRVELGAAVPNYHEVGESLRFGVGGGGAMFRIGRRRCFRRRGGGSMRPYDRGRVLPIVLGAAYQAPVIFLHVTTIPAISRRSVDDLHLQVRLLDQYQSVIEPEMIALVPRVHNAPPNLVRPGPALQDIVYVHVGFVLAQTVRGGQHHVGRYEGSPAEGEMFGVVRVLAWIGPVEADDEGEGCAGLGEAVDDLRLLVNCRRRWRPFRGRRGRRCDLHQQALLVPHQDSSPAATAAAAAVVWIVMCLRTIQCRFSSRGRGRNNPVSAHSLVRGGGQRRREELPRWNLGDNNAGPMFRCYDRSMSQSTDADDDGHIGCA
mmetsp:Transcript_32527/g.78759  ORF Transcript_32527/g.78759 Transcript_32527/m.78759 type:complete len:326 (+) Transcript_32527:1202-2179(+)